jgi:hypothetical protein
LVSSARINDLGGMSMRVLMFTLLIGIGLIPVQPFQGIEKVEIFRNVEVVGENGEYVVTGETRTKTGEFSYIVEDGHNELIFEKRKKVLTNYPKWSKFKIKIVIPQKNIPMNGTVTMYLFEKRNDGKIHAYPIELETKS